MSDERGKRGEREERKASIPTFSCPFLATLFPLPSDGSGMKEWREEERNGRLFLQSLFALFFRFHSSGSSTVERGARWNHVFYLFLSLFLVIAIPFPLSLLPAVKSLANDCQWTSEAKGEITTCPLLRSYTHSYAATK